MGKAPVSIFTFLIIATIFTVIWGRIILFNANKKYVLNLTLFIMRYSRAQQRHIHSIILGSFYYLSCIVASAVFSVIFDFNIFKYFLIKQEYIIFIFIGILAEMSVANIIMMTVTSSVKKVDWVEQIKNIPWINSISFMPEYVGPLVPLLGAFCEEFFFRGILFYILILFYPEVGVILPIAIVTVLFGMQQILNTVTFPQAVTMAIGTFAVSTIGCLLILYTGSFLPALISHESFVIFYFRQMGFQYHK